jgi:pyruvate dehydrogenase E1 component alpha subunit
MAEVDAAVAFSEASAWPDASVAFDDLYTDSEYAA